MLHRRLQECRAALLTSPTRTAIDIAFAWGFSLSTFYRAFQAAFGLSPGDLRAASADRGRCDRMALAMRRGLARASRNRWSATKSARFGHQAQMRFLLENSGRTGFFGFGRAGTANVGALHADFTKHHRDVIYAALQT